MKRTITYRRLSPALPVLCLLSCLALVAVFAASGILAPRQVSASTTLNTPSFIEPLATSLTFPDHYSSGGARGVAKGDFNGDGKLDLAVTAINSSGSAILLYVMLGNGDGTFQPPASLSVPAGANLFSVTARDFNRDGNLDLLVTDSANQTVLFYKGNGDGTFQKPVASPTLHHPERLAVADFNGDGKLDIATAGGFTDNSVAVMLGNGDGTFQPATLHSTGSAPSAIAIGDIDGHNGPDIVVGTYNQRTVEVLLNDGHGAFPSATTPFDTGSLQVQTLYVADFDGDGKPDVVAFGSGGPLGDTELVFMKGNGDGTFQTPTAQNSQQIQEQPYPILNESEPLDLNGDGKPDVVVGHGDLNLVTVGLGRGDGTFDLRELAASPGPGFTVDNQGTHRRVDGNGTWSIIAGDFNGDGNTDLVVTAFETNERPGGLSLILGSGGGNFLTPRNYSIFDYSGVNQQAPSSPSVERTTALGDVNNDGKLDFVEVAQGDQFRNQNVVVLPGAGDGTLGSPIYSVSVPTCPNQAAVIQALRLADMNHDGKLDLILPIADGCNGSNFTSIVYGNGDGTFSGGVSVAPGNVSWVPTNAIVADFNNDGVPDLAVLTSRLNIDGTSNGNHFEVFIQSPNSLGTFTRTAGYPQTDLGNADSNTQINSVGMVAADFDGDGKLDLIGTGSLNGNYHQVLFLKGNGDGTFQPPVSVGSLIDANGGGMPFANDLRAVDLRGDGKLDLIAVGYTAEVFLGNGNGTFQPPVYYGDSYGLSSDGQALDIADLDGDGTLDLAIGYGIGNFMVLPGKGDGTFAPSIYFATGRTGNHSSVHIGDLNGDGKPDVVIGHPPYGGEYLDPTVLINNAGSLSTLSLRPNTVAGGNASVGTLKLNNPAPSTGAKVTLTSSNPTLVSVPSSATIAAGTTSRTFSITTHPVSQTTTVIITATYGGATQTAILTLQPLTLSSLSISPSTLTGGCQTASGKVTLNGAALAGGAVVQLTNSNTAASMPTSVMIPAGKNSATFTITTTSVTSTVSGTVTASYGGVTKSVTLKVLPVQIQTLNLSPNPVVGGNPVTGTVTLSCADAQHNTVVTLTSSAPSVANPTAASITIPAGSTTGNFTVNTSTVSATMTVTITAKANGAAKSVKLTVNP